MMNKATTIDVKFRPLEWYRLGCGADVRHLVGVPGIYVTDVCDEVRVFLSIDDVANMIGFSQRLGWDPGKLACACIVGLAERNHLAYDGVMYYRVQERAFVQALRFLKRERRKKSFAFDATDFFRPISDEELALFIDDPDHADDLAP